MPRVKLESLAEGMIIAADVKNMDDMLLIPAGCELSARHINILRTWGISDVQVEGEENGSMTLMKLSPEVLDRLQNELKTTFWELDEKSSVQQEIFKLALRNRARSSLNQLGHGSLH